MVLAKESDTPPTVSVVLVDVLLAAALVWRTQIVWPLVTLPAAVVNVPAQSADTVYDPPVTATGAGTSIPDIVIGAEVTSVDKSTSAWSTNVKASGVVSDGISARVVLVKVPTTPPIVSVVVIGVGFANALLALEGRVAETHRAAGDFPTGGAEVAGQVDRQRRAGADPEPDVAERKRVQRPQVEAAGAVTDGGLVPSRGFIGRRQDSQRSGERRVGEKQGTGRSGSRPCVCGRRRLEHGKIAAGT